MNRTNEIESWKVFESVSIKLRSLQTSIDEMWSSAMSPNYPSLRLRPQLWECWRNPAPKGAAHQIVLAGAGVGEKDKLLQRTGCRIEKHVLEFITSSLMSSKLEKKLQDNGRAAEQDYVAARSF